MIGIGNISSFEVYILQSSIKCIMEREMVVGKYLPKYYIQKMYTIRSVIYKKIKLLKYSNNIIIVQEFGRSQNIFLYWLTNY